MYVCIYIYIYDYTCIYNVNTKHNYLITLIRISNTSTVLPRPKVIEIEAPGPCQAESSGRPLLKQCQIK